MPEKNNITEDSGENQIMELAKIPGGLKEIASGIDGEAEKAQHLELINEIARLVNSITREAGSC